MTKYCKQCNKHKLLSAFGKQKETKDGYKSLCLVCIAKNYKLYRISEIGLITVIYNGHIRRTKKNGYSPVAYTRKELIDWCIQSNVFKDLYTVWTLSDYKKDLTPSIDRLDDYLGYSFSNIQIITFKDNREKYYRDAQNGINTKCAVPVMQFSKDMKYITTFPSCAIAANAVGIASSSNISRVCKGFKRSSGGFIWKYTE